MSKKLLIETHTVKISPSQLNENINKENGNLLVEGILATAEVKNGNGRYYPRELWEREIDKYMQSVKENRALGELDHPDSSVINLNNVSHNIVEVTMKGGDVHGVVEILTTPAGNILKELFRCGVTVGISSRGMGSVEENSDGVLMVQEDFDLLCFDFVSTPSTPGAYMSPMNEGVITPTKDYTKVNNVIRDIICDNTGMCKC